MIRRPGGGDLQLAWLDRGRIQIPRPLIHNIASAPVRRRGHAEEVNTGSAGERLTWIHSADG